MTLSIDAFRASFPEFDTTSPALLQAKLNEAGLSIDPCIWGAKADLGQGYLAAHLITLSPKGQNARMVVSTKDGGQQATTTYWGHYKRLQREVAVCASGLVMGQSFLGPSSPWPSG